jgi:hypothetical protein
MRLYNLRPNPKPDSAVVNLTTGVQMHWPCTSEFCSGMVDLVLGVNQIVVTTYDLAGKRGSTRITIERKTSCP